MAITNKHAMMVHYPEGTSNSTLAPQTSACPLFVVLQQLHPVKGSQDVHTLLVKKESSPVEKSNTTSSSTLFNKMSLNKMSLESVVASDTSSQECNLPAETTCNGMTVTLDNNNMWNEFFKCKTEMILTKQGRRMFPYCRFHVSGLEPFQRYILVMDMHPVDKYRYKWSDRRWEANGKAEPHNPSSFVHPDSPATGFDWMQNPVSFYKLKLTNNYSDKEAKISLNSMHRYLPRLHIIPADKVVDLVQLNEPDVTTFTFLQTEFFAVTAYQNLSITQLKIDYNPFAKGFREDANNSRSGKPKNGPFSEKLESEARSSQNITLNNLKSLFVKRNTVEKAPTNGDHQTVHCNSPINSEPEKKLSNRKRPWTEGLSELIKNTHVKVQRISSVKDPDVNDQQNNTCLETGTLDCKPENLSVSAFAKARSNPDTNIMNRTVTNVNVSIEEGSVALLEFTDSSMINTTNSSEQTTCSTPINEIVATTLTETSVPAENDNIMETSQSANCGEKVKKKRAEPVPLPLLALFLQQLKSKTKPAKSVSQSETHSLSSNSKESCDTTSVADSNIALTITPNVLEDTAQSSASEAVRATTPDASLNEPEHCNVPTYASSPVSLNASTDIFSRQAPETQLSDISMFSSLQVSSSSDESSTPSSPDPFPPSMFSDRPIPRRKILNPFPSCLSSARPSPLVVLPDPLPGSFLGRSRDGQDFSIPAIYSVRCEGTSSVSPSDFSKKSEQFLHTTAKITSTHSKVEHLKLTTDTVAAPEFEMSKNTVIMEPVSSAISLAPFIPTKVKEPFQDIVSTQPDMKDEKESLLLTTKELSADTTSVCGMKISCPAISHDSGISKKTKQSKRIKSKAKHKICGKSQLSQGTDAMDDPIHLQCVLLTEERFPVQSVSSETFDSDISTTIDRPLNSAAGKRTKLKHRLGAKAKICEDSKLREDPTSLPLQPSLEDVDGQLFASFKSKNALKIHLGAQDGEGVLEPNTGNTDEELNFDENKRINALEKHLLHDLNIMRHRQVIHPVLQAVGLKLNLLDHSLAIDLQYLGVCLPIPSPAVLPDESSRSSSSQFSYVSRTGKTTDLTKIKGWRDKFATTNSSSIPADAGQKNLSAFCSDMLDEYLESECKFIDERVTSFSQAAPISPIAYQMPTKSTSYVRTLDSILKKQTPQATDISKSSTATESTTVHLKSKKVVLSGKKMKKSAKTAAANKDATSIKEKSLKKMAKPATKSASLESSAGYNLTQNKESDKIKTKKRLKTSQASVQLSENSAEGSSSAAPVAQNFSSNHGSSTTGGRRLTLNKTLVKLMDVEDGAVWEGKHRTYITEERAAIALSCLITAEGPMEKTSSTIIKRRAPPCLNDFCRLGCICASLSHQRRQHHCCKPQCMLGCNCLRHKVLLKSPATNVSIDMPLNQNSSKENQKKLKKCKKQMSYILFEPESAPEPATRVKKLWDHNCDTDLDQVFIPSMSNLLGHPVLSPEQQQKVERIPHPLPRRNKEDLKIRKNKENCQGCARVRPFCWSSRQAGMKDNAPTHSPHHLQQEMEELGAPTQSGPSKRLEIVSKCRWATKGNIKNILHTLCEHMTQDRLDHPVWIGKFQIKLISKTLSTDTKEGPTLTYRVAISQPKLESEKQVMADGTKQLKGQLIKAIGNSKVKGLPLLSMVTPAGLLQAKKKSPGSSGHIIVNGKPYPQAKLELGKMGALHPANRLAAYITGRACPTNKPATRVLNSATTPTPSATTSSSVPTSSVTSILSSILASVVPTRSKSSLGKDTVINFQKQILPGSSLKLIIPSSTMTMATGVSNSSSIPPKTNLVSQPSPLSVTKVVKIIFPKPGPAKPKETTTACTTEPSGALPSAGVRLMQPVNLAKQTVPGQKMMAFKAAKGNFLCRDSSGKLIHLMPLSQLKALKRKLVMSKLPYILPLPASNKVPLSKPQNHNPASTTVPSPTSSSSVPLQNLTSIHRSTTVTSTIATKSLTSLSGSKCLLINSQPGMIKIHPKFLSNSNTSTLRIVPQNDETTQAVNDFKIIQSTALDQSSLEVYPDQGFIQLAPQSCITPNGQNIQNSVQVSSVSSEGQDVKTHQCTKSTNELVFTNHGYTNEIKTTTSPEKSAEMPEVISAYNTLKQEPSEFVPIKQEQETNVNDAVEDVEIKSESSELTEDSDLYDETETAELSVDGDLHHTVTGSTSEKRNIDREDSSDDDELVDIETIKERSQDMTLGMKQPVIRQEDSSSEESENEESGIVTLKRQKVTSERKRRIALKNRFDRLMQTLHVENPKVSKIKLLRLALKEIKSLNEQRFDLQKTQNNLQEERSYFLDKATRLSGKSEESIHKKLNELITKEKSLGVKDTSNHASLPKSKLMGQNFTQDFNIDAQNCEQSQQIRNDDSLGPAQLSVSVTNSSTINPSLQLQNKCSEAKPVGERERTRPNILARRMSNTQVSKPVFTPPVIPLGISSNPMILSNQMILIQNPLQPVNSQPITSGVAAVSLSVPYFANPIHVENPPICQPQVKPTDTTIPVKKLILPLDKVVSLVAPKDPTSPSSAVLQNTDIPVREQTQATSNLAPVQAQQNASLIGAQQDQLSSNVVSKNIEQSAKVSTVDALTKPKGSSSPSIDQENESLMSLLDELVFLNQQMNNDASKPEEEPQKSTEAKDPLTNQLTEKDVNLDECSLSPLFLKLNEDLASTSKDEETSNILSKVPEPITFESDFLCSQIKSEPVTSSRDVHLSAFNPSPPPLLQMKVSRTTSVDSMKNQTNLSWRPMPKLAPLGLKTHEAGQPKST